MTLSTHNTRIITGLILLAIFLTCALLGGWFSKTLVLLVACVGVWEFFHFFWPEKKEAVRLKIAGLTISALTVLFFNTQDINSITPFFLLSFFSTMLAFLFSYGCGKEDAQFAYFTPLITSILYIVFPLCLALQLTFTEQVYLVLIAIATDCGGYFAGMYFGKRKLWEKVSPKKTWEGSLGGILSCLVMSICFGVLVNFFSQSTHPWWSWLVSPILFNIAAQLGDFFESALKRSCGVKDSGTILPGHGGVLDRIDSVLFIVPSYVLFHGIIKTIASFF